MKELFKKIKETLAEQVPEVKHVDLWNRNVEFIEQDEGWEMPAVFVEFGPVAWEPLKDGLTWRGKGLVRLHIVTEWNAGGQDAAWDVSGEVLKALSHLVGDTFGALYLTETLVSHDHEEVLETIEVYSVRYLKSVK